MNLFAKANAGLALTPAQRATLRLVEGLLATAAVAALGLVAQYMAGHDLSGINYADLARYALGAFLVALIFTALKYVKAHADPAIGAALTPVADNATQAIGQWADIAPAAVEELDHATDSAGMPASATDSPATPPDASVDTPAA